MMNELVVAFAVLLAQPATSPSIIFDPASPDASGVHWIVTLSAPYCGGVRIGDGVYIEPEAPLSLPGTVAADAVLFDGKAAEVDLQAGVLRVRPSPALAQSMICLPGNQLFTVELLSSLGLANPGAGDYVVDVWIGSGSTLARLPIAIAAPGATPWSACDPFQARVDEAPEVLQSDSAALGQAPCETPAAQD